MNIYGFIQKNGSREQPYNIFCQYYHKIYWYDAISTINLIKIKHALELKLSNFKNFENCWHFVSFTDHNNRPTA